MTEDQKPAPNGFEGSTQLPADERERDRWQAENREWWENHPMRYDWKQAVRCEEFSAEFYREIDRRFFSSAREFMPWKKTPFDPLIDFDALENQDVLEIGVGNGSHAQLLAGRAKSFTGVDLTGYAVKSTTERLKLAGAADATILQMDAEKMAFADDSFDFVWSWGVIHHSANTEAILAEIERVLRPGGRAAIMVYHRSFWKWCVIGGLFHGILRGDLFRTKSLHKTLQKHTDGAMARFYTRAEWRALTSKYFDVAEVRIYGSKVELLPLPMGKIKNALLALFPNALGRFFTNWCRMGVFLYSALEKKADASH